MLIAVDFETLGLTPHLGGLRLIQTCCSPGSPVEIWDCFEHGIERTQDYLRTLLKMPWIAHNLKFEAAWTHKYTQEYPTGHCTARAAKVLANGLNYLRNDLWSVLERQLPHIKLDRADYQTSDWSGPLSPEQLKYAAQDVLHLHALWGTLENGLRDTYTWDAYCIDMAPIRAEIDMERNGIGIDTAKWLELARKAELKATVDCAALEMATPTYSESCQTLLEYNFSSPKQVKGFLLDHGVCVAATKWNKEGSTSRTALIPYGDHLIVQKLLEARESRKKTTTYGKSWLDTFLVDGRVHTNFRLATDTGRYSSSKPNLQQIPRDGRYRGCFIASPGKVLVGADYSAIELRVAAWVAREDRMLAAFKKGLDVHRHTSTLLFGISYDDVTKAQRQSSKALSFGLLYGMGAEKLVMYARQGYGVHLSLNEATELRNRFFRVYPGLRTWQQHEAEAGASRGYALTPSGRRRYFPFPCDVYTQYLNTCVQGCAADIMKWAMADLQRRLPPDISLLLSIHDEILLETTPDRVEVARQHLQQSMVNVGEEQCTAGLLAIEAKTGLTWADCH